MFTPGAMIIFYLLRNHHLYADNFYSSLGLIRDLHDADTYFCGTIRKNSRGLPKQISDTALQRGQSEKLSADRDIVFCRWYDRQNMFAVAMNTIKPRNTPNDLITVPEMIVDYNRNMGGVDHLDQFRGYYNVGRAGRKWWKYVLFGLFNFAMVNAYILKCLANRPLPSNQREWSLLTFRMAVMHQMCDNFSSRKRAAKGSIHEVASVLERNIIKGHDLVLFEGRKKACQACISANRRTPSKRCVETSYGCSLGRVSLCKSGPCFREHHGF